MLGRGTVLQVQYFSQPTSDACQSILLKMIPACLEENVLRASTGGCRSRRSRHLERYVKCQK